MCICISSLQLVSKKYSTNTSGKFKIFITTLKINIKYVFILYMGKIESKTKGINTNSILTNSQIDHAKTINKEFHGKVKIGTASGLAVAGGETAPIYDPDERDGWLFTKPIADTAKFNYFFYSQGNKAITLADINSIYANVIIDNYQGINSLPFFVVYTKMTGVGDAGAWYHSKIAYTLTPNEDIILGEEVILYSGDKPDNHNHIRHVESNLKIITGDALSTEEVYTISIHSDSGSLASTQILVSTLGLNIYHGDKKLIKKIQLV